MTTDAIPLLDARAPVLLNTWKHHAGVLRVRIRQAVAAGASGLDTLARQLVVMGGELMDLYTGALSPEEIGEQVLAYLESNERLELPVFRNWLNKAGGYALMTLDDGSGWVLRLGDEDGRYVHAHPGRWVPHTCRVRANVLKTAVLSLAFAAMHGCDPLDARVVNQVRRDYLKLAPLGRDLRGDQGIGSIIDVLKRSEAMTRRAAVRKLFDHFAAAEQAAQEQEFLAPALRGGEIHVRIAGIVCRFRIERNFEGWGVFGAADANTAQLLRPARLAERQRYLDLLPDRRLVLCARDGRHWLAWPAHQRDGRFGPPSVVIVHLTEEVEPFDTVVARFDGARHWFERLDERADPATAAYLRAAIADETAPDKVRRTGLTAETRAAYALAHALLVESQRDPTEDRLRFALAHAGAEFMSYLKRQDGYRVEFTVDGARHVSLIGAADLTVQLAGICLSGEDRRFDLSSLVSVLREADAEDVLRVGAEGLPADQYWQVHPRR